MRDDNFHGRLTTASRPRNANKPCPTTSVPNRVSPLSRLLALCTWRVCTFRLGSHALTGEPFLFLRTCPPDQVQPFHCAPSSFTRTYRDASGPFFHLSRWKRRGSPGARKRGRLSETLELFVDRFIGFYGGHCSLMFSCIVTGHASGLLEQT